MKNNEQASNSSHNVALPAVAPAERVTVASRPSKDPKKVAAGRAGAAARKAKHERLLEELRTTKESFRAPDDVTREHVAAVPGASQQWEQQEPADKWQHNNQTDWTPWIIGLTGTAALAAAALRVLPAKKPKQTTDVPAPVQTQSRTCF